MGTTWGPPTPQRHSEAKARCSGTVFAFRRRHSSRPLPEKTTQGKKVTRRSRRTYRPQTNVIMSTAVPLCTGSTLDPAIGDPVGVGSTQTRPALLSHAGALGVRVPCPRPSFAGFLRETHVLERLTARYVQSSVATTMCANTTVHLLLPFCVFLCLCRGFDGRILSCATSHTVVL